jgi:hypothetical protein
VSTAPGLPRLLDEASRIGTRGSWVVWRQGDNDNRMLVSRHPDRAEADRVAAEFTARGHRQSYWVERDEQLPTG